MAVLYSNTILLYRFEIHIFRACWRPRIASGERSVLRGGRWGSPCRLPPPCPFPARPPVSPAPRVTATTPSSAASGTASAMKSEEVKLPSASSAPANPLISTATTTRPHPCRNSRSANRGVGSGGSGTAGNALVSPPPAHPPPPPALLVQAPARPRDH